MRWADWRVDGPGLFRHPEGVIPATRHRIVLRSPQRGIACTVEDGAQGVRCRIERGGAPEDVAACARWEGGRPRTRVLGGAGELERELALHAAHKLSQALAADAEVRIALGAAGAAAEEVAALTEEAERLARQAAHELGERRLRERLGSPRARAILEPRIEPVAAAIERFLERPREEILRRHRREVRDLVRARFGGRVLLFAPLYLTDACRNDCSYCGFRRSSFRSRRTLSADEAVAEARVLAAHGLRTIDLVTGEIPTDRFVDEVARATERILAETPIERVHLNLGALSLEQYRRLVAAGAKGYHLYQETYDPAIYFQVHRCGPKRDLAARLEAAFAVAEAGFEAIGLGLLLGLRELAFDLARLTVHAEELRREHPALGLGFSLPRIRRAEAAEDFEIPHPVDDDVFFAALLFLRLRFPDAHLTLTTREQPALRDELVRVAGVTKLSAGVSTAPGGYGAGGAAGTDQFAIADERSVEEVAAMVRAAGLTPVFTP